MEYSLPVIEGSTCFVHPPLKDRSGFAADQVKRRAAEQAKIKITCSSAPLLTCSLAKRAAGHPMTRHSRATDSLAAGEHT
ncbi:MAG TPA: hypothetical protein VL992_02065, partial [Tepidisphaeraceae bacterium]|nr:hypothetical protein [Tepidisphaeraceae bacterium]